METIEEVYAEGEHQDDWLLVDMTSERGEFLVERGKLHGTGHKCADCSGSVQNMVALVVVEENSRSEGQQNNMSDRISYFWKDQVDVEA